MKKNLSYRTGTENGIHGKILYKSYKLTILVFEFRWKMKINGES